MRATAFVLLFSGLSAALAGHLTAPPAGFLLAGRPVAFSEDSRPLFTPHQISSSSQVTRAGFDRWARTAEGANIIGRLRQPDMTIVIEEDPEERSLGRAPQPAFTTLLAARERSVHKRYTVVLNPTAASLYEKAAPLNTGLPKSAVDAMALAWAAEMLHIAFYAEGVALPHHERADFQERWRAVTAELGLPNATHGDQER